MKYTLQSRGGNGKTLYVTELRGQGGTDWGYSTRPADALRVSLWWKRRFMAENVPGRTFTEWEDSPKTNPRKRIAKHPRTPTLADMRRAYGNPVKKRTVKKNPSAAVARRAFALSRKKRAYTAPAKFGYKVEFKGGDGVWVSLGSFAVKANAIYYAKAWHRAHKMTVRVSD